MTARLLRDPRVAAGVAIIGALALLAFLAPWLAPFDPLDQAELLRSRLLPPLAAGPEGAPRWLGTDQLGRDVLSRLLHGARVSLAVGALAALLSAAIGTALGALAAAGGRRLDRVVMAATDAALALPRLVLLLALVALFQPSAVLIVLVLGATGWMPVARLARAEMQGVMARPYAAAARAAGVGPLRLLLRHVLPNALTPVLVATALAVGNAITLEAGLAFLGLGIPAPAPSWGNMIATGRDALVQAPWLATLPGLAVAVAVVGCNLLADGLRDQLDPRTAR
ncbi:MAG TPA: ABC transporter permease [Gemmatimonadales bacterium]